MWPAFFFSSHVIIITTSWINAVMFFLFSAQADDRVRVEKRDGAQFEFASAMKTVTEFYCHTQEKGGLVPQFFFFRLLYSPCWYSHTLIDTKTDIELKHSVCVWVVGLWLMAVFVMSCAIVMCVCVSMSPRLSFSIKCSIPGEPSDLLSGTTHSVPPRVQLRKSSSHWKVCAPEEVHTFNNTGCKYHSPFFMQK